MKNREKPYNNIYGPWSLEIIKTVKHKEKSGNGKFEGTNKKSRTQKKSIDEIAEVKLGNHNQNNKKIHKIYCYLR